MKKKKKSKVASKPAVSFTCYEDVGKKCKKQCANCGIASGKVKFTDNVAGYAMKFANGLIC